MINFTTHVNQCHLTSSAFKCTLNYHFQWKWSKNSTSNSSCKCFSPTDYRYDFTSLISAKSNKSFLFGWMFPLRWTITAFILCLRDFVLSYSIFTTHTMNKQCSFLKLQMKVTNVTNILLYFLLMLSLGVLLEGRCEVWTHEYTQRKSDFTGVNRVRICSFFQAKSLTKMRFSAYLKGNISMNITVNALMQIWMV